MGNYFLQPEVPDCPEKDDIMNTVSKHCVVIYSKTNCSYCKEAKSIFKKLKVPTKVIELDKRKDGELLQNILASMTNASTVPRVFVNGECIGGASETRSLHRRGKLAEMTSMCRRRNSRDINGCQDQYSGGQTAGL